MLKAAIRNIFILCGTALLISPASAGDVALGEELYVKCVRCHSLDPAGSQEEGPHLHQVFGRTAGSLETYPGYSDAMKASGVIWDEASLDEYLTKPKDFIPGTNMRFRQMKKEEDRANLIAYLREATK
jgi:cytochrome c